MPLQATSGAASYDAFGGGVAAVPTYIEDIFSTTLYTGNDSTQTINNGIDLAGKGGMVWVKGRDIATENAIVDTVRGVNKNLLTDQNYAQNTDPSVSAFNSNGFSINSIYSFINDTGYNYVSWTFREAPKFFDVVTYTGNGTSQNIAHSLGSVPGCIIVKDISNTRAWSVYHTSLGNTQNLILSGTNAAATAADWNNTTPTATEFTVGTNVRTNASGATYVAYLFAHNAGGFGLSGTDNVISCGSWSGNTTVNLGYEPQWILFRNSGTLDNWTIVDNMRGWPVGAFSQQAQLYPNTSGAESGGSGVFPTATGFNANLGAGTYIYIAIRRGPMKVPETGTSVFGAGTRSGSGSVAKTNSNILTDLTFIKNRTSGGEYWAWTPRLVGNLTLQSNSTDAELTGAMATNPWDTMTGAFCAASNGATNSGSLIDYSFRRAPGFHDVVCYTGTGSAQTLTHNLGVAPELIITKNRTQANIWYTYSQTTGATQYLRLNTTDATATGANVWNNTAPTASQFTVGSTLSFASGDGFVAYLFASAPGVSKVGSYTGTGTTQTINCGFTGGARFVLIKRTDSTGDWYVWDTARGIVSGNDPYLLLNSRAAEVTNTDFIDTASTGFEISSTAPAAINANGGTFLFLAIA